MRRLIIYLFSALFLLIVISLSWLVLTESGLSTVVTLTQKYVPELTIKNASGRLYDGALFSDIDYQIDDSSNVSINNLALGWQAAQLLSGRIMIDKLMLDEVVITLSTVESENSEPVVLPKIVFPLPIYLENLHVNSITIADQKQQSVEVISGLKGVLRLWGDEAKINYLLVEYLDKASIEFNGTLKLRNQYKTDMVFNWIYMAPQLKDITAEGKITGDMTALQVEQQLLTPVRSSQVITLSNILDTVNWQLDAHIPELNVADIVYDQSGVIHNLVLKATGDLTTANLLLDTQYKQSDLPALSLHSQASTEDFDNWIVATELLTNDNSKVAITGQLHHLLTAPKLSLTGEWQQLAWPLLEEEKTVSSAKGEFSVNGTMESYDLVISGDVEAEKQYATFTTLAEGTASQIRLKKLDIHGFEGIASTSGWVNWAKTPLEYHLLGKLSDITIPEAFTENAIAINKGDFSVSGTLADWSVTADSNLTVNGTPVAINLTGMATEKGFSSLTLHSEMAAGQVKFNGQFLWLDQLSINGTVNLIKVNPQFIAPDWPGELSGSWKMAVANIGDNTADITIEKLDVNGTLRQRAIRLQTELSYLNRQLMIPNLRLNSGRSEITANGHMKERLALNWKVHSPDLADLYPDISGELAASGTVSGDPAEPVIAAKVDGKKITYGDNIAVAKIISDFSLDLSKQGKLQGKASLADVQLEQLQNINAELAISGSKDNHQFKFDVSNKDLNASGHVAGALTENHWLGQLTQLQLDHSKLGQWQSTEQGKIVLAKDQGKIGRHCLKSQQGSLCAQANYSQDGDWSSKGEFNAVSVELLQVFTAALDSFQGKLNGHFELAGNGQYPHLGEGEMSLTEGKILLDKALTEQQEDIALRTFKLDVKLTEESMIADLLVVPELQGVSPITGNIILPNAKISLTTPEQANLTGYLKATIEDLSVFDALHQEYDNLKGRLDVDINLAGTAANPAMIGSINLTKAAVELPSAGITLTAVNASAQGNLDKGIEFQYQAKSGEGTLSGSGNFITSNSGWQLVTDIKGDNVELINLPEAYVIASPNITFKLNQNSAHVDGTVTVPIAELAPLQFNMPVTPSKDVIVVNQPIAVEETSLPTIVNIKLILGDKVNVTAVGFEGRLTGGLLITGDTSKILLASGKLLIKDGSYEAYGQKLAVEDGKIDFSGGAIDNPDVDIKAIRKGNNFVAGLQLLGPADNPQVNLFSTPTMSQDNILAHLLLGRPIADASVTDAAMLASAASGLGIKGGNQIGEQIASTFGLDTFSINGDGGGNTALQIGKYLSPKLYIGYGIGIFEPVSTVKLQYKLSKIWALKAESGVETGVDFLYTHER